MGNIKKLKEGQKYQSCSLNEAAIQQGLTFTNIIL